MVVVGIVAEVKVVLEVGAGGVELSSSWRCLREKYSARVDTGVVMSPLISWSLVCSCGLEEWCQ